MWSVKGLSYNSSALGGETQGPFDRHRLYRETDDLFGPDSQWRAEDLLPWWVLVHTPACPLRRLRSVLGSVLRRTYYPLRPTRLIGRDAIPHAAACCLTRTILPAAG